MRIHTPSELRPVRDQAAPLGLMPCEFYDQCFKHGSSSGLQDRGRGKLHLMTGISVAIQIGNARLLLSARGVRDPRGMP